MKKKTDFVAALRVVVLALPYALVEAGLETKKIVLLTYLVFLTVFCAYLLIFWIGRYRNTSHRISVVREDIGRNRRSLESVRARVSEAKKERNNER